MSFFSKLSKIIQQTIEDCLRKNPEIKGYFPTKEAAQYLDISHQKLEIARSHGGGPPFIKLGRLVRYKKTDLDAWMASHRRNTEVE